MLISRIHTSSSHHAPRQCSDSAEEWIRPGANHPPRRKTTTPATLVAANSSPEVNPRACPLPQRLIGGASIRASALPLLIVLSEFLPVTNITGRIDPHQQLGTTAQRRCRHQTITTMDRNTNINCLCSLFATFKQTSDDATRLRIRQAIYIHRIVAAVLTERVDMLPEASFASR